MGACPQPYSPAGPKRFDGFFGRLVACMGFAPIVRFSAICGREDKAEVRELNAVNRMGVVGPHTFLATGGITTKDAKTRRRILTVEHVVGRLS